MKEIFIEKQNNINQMQQKINDNRKKIVQKLTKELGDGSQNFNTQMLIATALVGKTNYNLLKS